MGSLTPGQKAGGAVLNALTLGQAGPWVGGQSVGLKQNGTGMDRSLGRLSRGQYVGAPKLVKQTLRQDVYNMLNDKLGPTQAEADQARQHIGSQIYQQTGQSQRDMARAMLGAPSAMQDTFANAQQGLANAGAEATATGNAQVTAQAQQQRAAEAALIQQRLTAQQERYRQNASTALKYSSQLAQTIGSAVGGAVSAGGGALTKGN